MASRKPARAKAATAKPKTKAKAKAKAKLPSKPKPKPKTKAKARTPSKPKARTPSKPKARTPSKAKPRTPSKATPRASTWQNASSESTSYFLTMARRCELDADYQGARDAYLRAIEVAEQLGESSGGSRMCLLDVLDRLGDDEAVLALADELDGKGPAPASGRVVRVLSAMMNIARTNAYLRTGRASDAVDAARAALADIERDGGVVAGPAAFTPCDAWFRLGLALRMSGDAAGAIEPFRRSLGFDSMRAHTHFQLAIAHNDAGDPAEAARAAERTIELDPDDNDAHYNLACYRALLGDRDRALEALEHAIRLDGGNAVLARDDADLESLRADPAFVRLTAG